MLINKLASIRHRSLLLRLLGRLQPSHVVCGLLDLAGLLVRLVVLADQQLSLRLELELVCPELGHVRNVGLKFDLCVGRLAGRWKESNIQGDH